MQAVRSSRQLSTEVLAVHECVVSEYRSSIVRGGTETCVSVCVLMAGNISSYSHPIKKADSGS